MKKEKAETGTGKRVASEPSPGAPEVIQYCNYHMFGELARGHVGSFWGGFGLTLATLWVYFGVRDRFGQL